MTRYIDSPTVLLAGFDFDEEPHLSLIDADKGTRLRFGVRGKTFSLRRLPQRRCTGRHNLETHTTEVCPLNIELLPGSKDTMCPACMEATGFNPSFYYADIVSPQQRAYNLTPHYVYLAYFAPAYIKAGITGAVRGLGRLLEQGARTACVVGRFEDAYKARELEAALCAQPGILETMRASKKQELLVEERYSFAEASATLKALVEKLETVDAVVAAGFTAAEPIQDLSVHYFGGLSPASDTLQIPEGHPDECGGRCLGMVGNILVFEQEGTNYAVSLKEWEAHAVDLFLDEVICAYSFTPQQMSLL